MQGFENGVKFYTKAIGEIIVNFPENRTVCQWCPYCRNEDSLRRWKCLITGEYIVYPFDCIGDKCPLTLIKEERNDDISESQY